MLTRLAVLAGIVLWTLAGVPAAARDRESQAGTVAPAGAAIAVRYVANSGMLVTLSGRRFLIDAPIRDGIPPYATSSAAERTLLEAARGPYADVDAILVTHWHEDHFSAGAVAAHLSAGARTVLISSPEVVDRVRAAAPGVPAARLRAVLPAAGHSERVDVGGLSVHVLRIRHNPARRLPEQHVGFLIGGPPAVLHVGDADPAADNFGVCGRCRRSIWRCCRSGTSRTTRTGAL